MFTSWYLSQNVEGLKALFVVALVCAVACVGFCLYFKTGRTKSALVRLAVALVAADVMTELSCYLGYMGYFPGHDPMTQSARLFPTVIFPVLYFGGAAFLVKLLNDILGR